MPALQTFKNHDRFDPPIHFFVVPVLIVNFLVWVGISIMHHRHGLPLHIWIVIVSLALVVLAVRTRLNDLKNQDRIIRLEERVRYAALLSPSDLAASARLTLRQIVALRFASDAELPALITRTMSQSLTPKQIKQSIGTWRPDYDRV
jgi:hypothetical protein